MQDEIPVSREVLAKLYEFLKKQQEFMYEQGFKVQAMELTLRSFPDTLPAYETSLSQARSEEAVRKMRTGLAAFDAEIAALRSNQFGSA